MDVAWVDVAWVVMRGCCVVDVGWWMLGGGCCIGGGLSMGACGGCCMCIKQDRPREHEVDLSQHQRRLLHEVCVRLRIACMLDIMTHDATLIYDLSVAPEDVWVCCVWRGVNLFVFVVCLLVDCAVVCAVVCAMNRWLDRRRVERRPDAPRLGRSAPQVRGVVGRRTTCFARNVRPRVRLPGALVLKLLRVAVPGLRESPLLCPVVFVGTRYLAGASRGAMSVPLKDQLVQICPFTV